MTALGVEVPCLAPNWLLFPWGVFELQILSAVSRLELGFWAPLIDNPARRPTGKYSEMRLWEKGAFPIDQEVKALSPHHRPVIALHSPHGFAETGLDVCPPEKNGRKLACGI
jgi:hypothetical protein